MVLGVAGKLVGAHGISESEVPVQVSEIGLLLVKECIPNGCRLDRVSHGRTSHVNSPAEALALPWIAKLPGKKRIRFVYGQVFVVQTYGGCNLIRAHVCLDEPPRREFGRTFEQLSVNRSSTAQ